MNMSQVPDVDPEFAQSSPMGFDLEDVRTKVRAGLGGFWTRVTGSETSRLV